MRRARSLAGSGQLSLPEFDVDQPKRLVYKANDLVESGCRLTLHEQRLFLFAVSKIRRDSDVDPCKVYRIKAKDYANFYAIKRSCVYRPLRQACSTLKNQKAWIVSKTGDELVPKPVVLVSRAQYVAAEGVVEISFHPDVIPYVSHLKSFTAYALVNIRFFSCTYAIRLYELLQQWSTSGQRTSEIGWLRDILGLHDKYKSFDSFRRRVIEPALADINEYSDIHVRWQPVKKGVRVTHLSFQFSEKARDETTKRGTSSGTIRGFSRELLQAQARPGETYPQVAERLEREQSKRKAESAAVRLRHGLG